MATTDLEIKVQRDLALFAYQKRKEYDLNNGMSKAAFMRMYDEGEITLATVYENLVVAIRNHNGIPTTRVSEEGRDFSNGGDMKIGVLKKDGDARRFCVSGVENKVGSIYFVGWNWLSGQPNFFCIPREVHQNQKRGIKIPVARTTGNRAGGKYNEFAFDTIEEMACAE